MPGLTLNQQRVAEIASSILQKNPVYLDTETTGLDKNAEIIEIAIVDDAGQTLIDQLVRPSRTIPLDAIKIHGITDNMVATAKSWPVLWPTIRGLLQGKTIAIYNAEFDVRMMRQSLERYRLPWRETLITRDVLDLFTNYRGALRRFRLDEAREWFQIPLQNAHRAVDDALLLRAVLRRMAGMDY